MIENLIKQAKLTRNTGDTESFPVMQITYLKKVADATIMLPTGYAAKGLPGNTLCLVFSVMANEELRYAMPLSQLNRMTGLVDGEVAIKNEKTEDYIYLRDDQIIEVSAEQQLFIDTLLTFITGDVFIEGDADIVGNTEIDGQFGCNGLPSQAPFPLGPPATNLASVITLANNIRIALINNGIGQ
ncbi:MAG: hypothetical protein KAS19_06290 [Anaerolineales bacterium]|nr:hypothetical protein [Anaerolineales bacterium]